jgi:hypothetical protein
MDSTALGFVGTSYLTYRNIGTRPDVGTKLLGIAKKGGTSYLGTDPNVGTWRDASKEAGTGEPVRERG